MSIRISSNHFEDQNVDNNLVMFIPEGLNRIVKKQARSGVTEINSIALQETG